MSWCNAIASSFNSFPLFSVDNTVWCCGIGVPHFLVGCSFVLLDAQRTYERMAPRMDNSYSIALGSPCDFLPVENKIQRAVSFPQCSMLHMLLLDWC